MTISKRTRLVLMALPMLGVSIAGSFAAQAQAQLTPEMKAQARQVMMACRSDYQKHCSTVQRGEGRVLACLKSRNDQLQPQCATALQDLPMPAATN